MEDWDVEQERRAGPGRHVPMTAVLAAVAGLVVIGVSWGVVMRDHTSPSPWSVLASSAGEAPEQGGAPDDAAVEQAARILLGGDQLSANDPNALKLSAGQQLVLRSRDAEVHVTPGEVTVGTGSCAPGPLITVDLAVERVSGSALLSIDDFTMRTPAGPLRPIEACSIEDPQPRTVVFAASEPGLLAYGPDPATPEAVWRLN